jgi:quinol monooxygenase YgiN
MLIQSIHFTFASEDADEAEGFLRELRDDSRKDKSNVFALWEEFRDKAALDTHIATEHSQRQTVSPIS